MRGLASGPADDLERPESGGGDWLDIFLRDRFACEDGAECSNVSPDWTTGLVIGNLTSAGDKPWHRVRRTQSMP